MRPALQVSVPRDSVSSVKFGGAAAEPYMKTHTERLGPSYFFISLVLGHLHSLLWYVPSSRYIWSSAPILFLQEQIKNIIIIIIIIITHWHTHTHTHLHICPAPFRVHIETHTWTSNECSHYVFMNTLLKSQHTHDVQEGTCWQQRGGTAPPPFSSTPGIMPLNPKP